MDPEDSLVDATHHDVAHAATIGTGPVDLARGTAGTGGGADEYTMPRAEASTALTAGELVGEYRIERKIGEGGMGVVYGAVHPLIGKRAAIKVLNKALCMQPEAVERFVTEARAANQIGHPNIVDVFAFGNLSDGRSYFVMEWLDGKSLAERLRKGLPPLAETIAILDEVAEALEAAHAKRIVHRDLKPDNVFLASAPGGKMKVKLLDFGIAKLLDDSAHRVTRTRTGSLMGTPLYVAPEQARGYEIDARVDVYSLGAMAFELLAGRPPFVADNAMDIVAMHLHQEPPSLATFAPGAPPVLIELVGRMLAKDPDARPGLAELRTALHRLADDAAAAALVPA
ncbi:MAG: serine/threonine protein kinase, partial [Myxococcales bacterium]|nr:serine/threonine protein kinase [Myxococcales bacterium]